MSDEHQILIASGVLLALIALILWLPLRWIRKHRPADFRSSFKGTAIAFFSFIALSVIIQIVDSEFDWFSIPFLFVRSVIPLIYALWIVTKLNTISVSSHPKSPLVNTSELHSVVDGVFRSESFLSALRTTLPKGLEDGSHGLDFIPFMLQSISERRESFRKSSRIFFWCTIVVGLVFSITVSTFGYFLIDEESAGTPKRVRVLEENVRQLSSAISVVAPDKTLSDLFDEACGGDMRAFSRVEPPAALSTNHQLIIHKHVANMEDVKQLESMIHDQSERSDSNPDYRSLLRGAYQSVHTFRTSYDGARYLFPQAVADVESAAKEVRASINRHRSLSIDRACASRGSRIGRVVISIWNLEVRS